ncbi:MAG: iron ABC transporter permease, partial [Nitrospiria bacterium]
MNRRLLMLLMVLLIILSLCASAAGTASSERRFESARPGYTYSFPRDHGAHLKFKIEWWYFTGNLVSEG